VDGHIRSVGCGRGPRVDCRGSAIRVPWTALPCSLTYLQGTGRSPRSRCSSPETSRRQSHRRARPAQCGRPASGSARRGCGRRTRLRGCQRSCSGGCRCGCGCGCSSSSSSSSCSCSSSSSRGCSCSGGMAVRGHCESCTASRARGAWSAEGAGRLTHDYQQVAWPAVLRVGAQPRDHSHGGGGRMRQEAQGRARRRTGDARWQSQAWVQVQVQVQVRRQTPAGSATEHGAAVRGSTEAFALCYRRCRCRRRAKGL
jgi:hypothetical protein